MSEAQVTRAGQRGGAPGRAARMWERGGRRRGGRGERLMVPAADFTSYYGKPVLNPPVWSPLDIAGYLFLGGLAGGSSLLAAGADLTGRPVLRRVARLSAATAISGSLAALVHDLGRPARFLNMLRVAKPTSPMSMGSWLLSAYAPAAVAAAVSEYVGLARPLGRPAGLAAATLGPAVAAYTGVLISDTAVPTWHDAYPELPFVFAGSSGAAAGGLALAAVRALVGGPGEAVPARRLLVIGAALDFAAMQRMHQRLELTGEPLKQGKAGRLLRAGLVLTLGGGVAGGLLAERSRSAAVAGGAAAVVGSICTRFGIFYAGVASAKDPKYTVGPQRERLARRSA